MADFDKHENEGVPAALHVEYTPSIAQRQAANVQYHGDAAVDVVFVHGLGSKFATTWAHKRKDGSRYYWLREQFPKDMPDARVLIYEYASHWYDDPVRTDLRECAAQLLRTLINDRRHAHDKKLCPSRRTRPIILVGHSFGGLVIKQAMVMASGVKESTPKNQYENHRDILASVAGVIFLGTPHRGTSFTWLAGIKSFFGKSVFQVQSNDEIINILTPSSPILHWVQEEFENTCADERLANLQLICYYEMRDIFPLRRRVVEQESATLDNAASRGMNASHLDMNTFYAGDDGQVDHNYDHFISDIQMVFREAQTHVPKRFNLWVYGSTGSDPARERLHRILNASREVQDTTYHRYLEIYRSAPYTCQWIHGVQMFKDWRARSPEQKALWINGHGGSGKSVLTSYIIHSIRGQQDSLDTRNEWTLCSNALNAECGAKKNISTVLFFFCGVDRASETTERILGTLIHQLLLAWPENDDLVKIASRLVQTVLSPRNLTETLAKMVSLVGPVSVIIDNLEDITHSTTDNPSTIIQWLSTLQSLADVQILISSQETPLITDAVTEHFNINAAITITDYSTHDIANFTVARSEAMFSKKPALEEKREAIMHSLHSRAQGSFQWVNSAFEHLKHVEDAQDVEPVLDDIEGNLLDSYDKTFQRLGFNRTLRVQRRMILCLKFMAASATPVTSADVKVAWLIQELLDSEKTSKADYAALFHQKTCDERIVSADADIRNYLNPIVDICSDGTLQFKHMSYLKALTRLEGRGSNPEAERFKFTLEDAHRDLSLICMTVCRFTTFVHANSFIDWRTPLMQYAWNFWAYHLQKSKIHFATVEEAAEKKREMKMNSEDDPKWRSRNALQTAFNDMTSDITYDALVYLEALMDFISRPLRAVPGRFSDREYVLSLQRAQESLSQPAKDLCTLRKYQYDSPSSRLEHARQKSELVTHFPETSVSVDAVRNEVVNKMSGTKAKVLGDTSTVRRLRVDGHLKSNPVLPRPFGSPKLFLEVARNLRTIALRFSVDPIYSALLATAGGLSFSPLHPLVYLAQLFEESGSYPFWDSVSPGRDLMEPFICPDKDPEYASAKFVLHCFEWRDARVDETIANYMRKTTGFYIRTSHLSIDIRPGHWKKGLTRVSTENFEQVKRLHKVKAEHFFVAQSTYNLFDVNEDFFQRNVFRPLANLHMKYSLLVHEQDEEWELQEDPQAVLLRHTPDEVREAPLKEFIRVLPSVMQTYFIHYIAFALESFGRLARNALGVHIAKIESAIVELRQVAAFFWRIYEPGELPPMKASHLILAVGFFVLRCLYFPSWGAYIWYHSWSQFSWAWKHPSAYVEIQKDYRFLFICFQLALYFVNNVIAQTAIIMTLNTDMRNTPIFDVSFIYAIFHSFCAIDRSLFAICSSLATLLACGKVMFSDIESVANMLKFSMLFWVMIFFDLAMAAIRLGALQNGGGWKAMLGAITLHMGLLYLICRNIMVIADSLYALTKPGRLIALWVFRFVLRASVVTAQGLAIGALFFLVFKAFLAIHKFIWDPYDVRTSLKNLIQASETVHNTLVVGGVKQYKRIGWYPLGEKEMQEENYVALANVQRGPPRALPPLERNMAEAQTSLSDTAGVVLGRVNGFLENNDIQERMDRMVLAAGDQIGNAVDGVGQQIGRALGDFGQITKGLSQGATTLALPVRDAIEGGHLKEE